MPLCGAGDESPIQQKVCCEPLDGTPGAGSVGDPGDRLGRQYFDRYSFLIGEISPCITFLFLSTIVSLSFAIAVFNRYRQRGGLHLLFWTIGLALYGLGTLTEVVMLFTFNALALKVWYLSGAMLTAAWLGQGSVNLLVRKRGVARVLNIALAMVSLAAILLIAVAPVTPAAASFNPG